MTSPATTASRHRSPTKAGAWRVFIGGLSRSTDFPLLGRSMPGILGRNVTAGRRPQGAAAGRRSLVDRGHVAAVLGPRGLVRAEHGRPLLAIADGLDPVRID